MWCSLYVYVCKWIRVGDPSQSVFSSVSHSFLKNLVEFVKIVTDLIHKEPFIFGTVMNLEVGS